MMKCGYTILGMLAIGSLAYSENESCAERQWNIATELFNKGDVKEAGAEFTKFLTDFPGSEKVSDAQYFIIICYVRLNDREKKIGACQQFIQHFPDDKRTGEVCFLLAINYYTAGDYEKAVVLFEKIIERYPGPNYSLLYSDSYLSHCIINSHYYLRLCYKNLLRSYM